MDKWFNYSHLYYFKTIVEQGSIAKASEFLRIGAPAISMQLKSFEDFLQKELFIRKNRSLVLTDTGKMVYDYSIEIFKLGTELMTTLDDQAYGPIKIQIGVQDSVPKNLISRITSYIHKNFDSIVSVFNGDADQMTLGVASHRFDLAILNNPPIINDKSIFYTKRLLRSKVVLAGSEKFLHLSGKPLSYFNKAPFILPTSHSGLRHKVELMFHQKKIDFRLAGEAADTVVQKNMAISGDGIIPIMKDAIQTYVATNQLFILKELPDMFDELWVVTGKRQIQNPIADNIIHKFVF